MIYAGILAGGIGERMQRVDIPKQYLMLGTKPIIIHTIEQFIINNQIEEIIVAAPKDWVVYTQDLFRRYLPQSITINVISGGNDKNKSLMQIVDYIDRFRGIKDDDIIVSHDAIRPFITQRIINENIEKARAYQAVNTVISPIDTIIESLDGEVISNIPLKRHMYQEQTPQTFNIKKLKELYETSDPEIIKNIPDAAKIFVTCGQVVYLVKGDYSNMKIITPYDLEVANALLKAEEND